MDDISFSMIFSDFDYMFLFDVQEIISFHLKNIYAKSFLKEKNS